MIIFGMTLIGVLILFLLRREGWPGNDSAESPLDLLKKRYVNGEISKEEYMAKKEILET